MSSSRKIKVQAALSFEKSDGNVLLCGRLILRGKDGEFESIQKKISDKCDKEGIDTSQLEIVFVKNDDSSVVISNQKELTSVYIFHKPKFEHHCEEHK